MVQVSISQSTYSYICFKVQSPKTSRVECNRRFHAKCAKVRKVQDTSEWDVVSAEDTESEKMNVMLEG